MSITRIAATALLTAALGLSACGIKGDPAHPVAEEDKKSQVAN